MSKTDPINPNVPAGSEDPKLGNDRIQELARAVAEVFKKCFYMGSDTGSGYTEDDAGEIDKIIIHAPQTSDPTNEANKGFIYTKDVSGKAELFWEDEDGNVIQLTSGGAFNAALLTGKTITTPTLTSPVINTGVSGTAVLDEDNMASDSDTKLATQQSIKAYGDTYRIKGWCSFTGTGTPAIRDSLNVSGLTDNGTGDYTVTWDTDFADTTYCVVVSSSAFATKIQSVAAGSVRVETFNSAGSNEDAGYVSVMAIGTLS